MHYNLEIKLLLVFVYFMYQNARVIDIFNLLEKKYSYYYQLKYIYFL